MKEVVELFRQKGLIFKELEEVDLKRLGIRKRLQAYLGVDLSNRYHLLFLIRRKSRFLRKDATDLVLLVEQLERAFSHKVAKKSLFLEAPLCSKAKELLLERGFRVFTL